MTLRDYFAAKAMSALLPKIAFPEDRIEEIINAKGIDLSSETEAFVAMMAYDFADVMLEARSK